LRSTFNKVGFFLKIMHAHLQRILKNFFKKPV
jgi:hypothetical protein